MIHLSFEQALRLENLRTMAAERPVHATALEQWVDAHHRGSAEPQRAVRVRVSGPILAALDADLRWIFIPPPGGAVEPPYPNAYRDQRVADARAAGMKPYGHQSIKESV